jgi:hypothetical protein
MKPTYEKRLGWVNVEEMEAVKGEHIGTVFPFMTRDGKPVLVPDQEELKYETQAVPVSTEAVTMYAEDYEYPEEEITESN